MFLEVDHVFGLIVKDSSRPHQLVTAYGDRTPTSHERSSVEIHVPEFKIEFWKWKLHNVKVCEIT